MSCSVRCWSQTFCLIGLAICCYALYVEFSIDADPEYQPMCDINEDVSCSKVLTSPYAKGFGLVQLAVGADHPLVQPNPVYGFFVYALLLLCSLCTEIKLLARIQLWVTVLCNLGSVYLGYILYFVLEDICVVCVATYFVNFVLLICSIVKVRGIRSVRQHDSFNVSKHSSNFFSLPTQSRPGDFKKNI